MTPDEMFDSLPALVDIQRRFTVMPATITPKKKTNDYEIIDADFYEAM